LLSLLRQRAQIEVRQGSKADFGCWPQTGPWLHCRQADDSRSMLASREQQALLLPHHRWIRDL